MINISVIIPNYDHGQFLQQRIESIINQTYKYFEIIILDDASSDNSKEIVESFRNNPLITKIVYNSENSGSPFKQWEKGIQMAKFEWIWIAESDDNASHLFLEEAINTINQDTKIGFYFCDSIVEEEDRCNTTTSLISEKLLSSKKWLNSYIGTGLEEINDGLRYFSNIPNTSAVLFKKEYAVKYLDHLKCFRYCGDWFLYIAILQNCLIGYNSNTLNTFRRTTTSLSVKDKDINVVKKKIELYKILKLLYSIPGIGRKDNLVAWFTKYHIGTGIKTEGLLNSIIILFQYIKIDFALAIRFISNRVKLKFYKFS